MVVRNDPIITARETHAKAQIVRVVVCVHEAGHAVVLGLGLGKSYFPETIEISLEQSSPGGAVSTTIGEIRDTDKAMRCAAYLIAGSSLSPLARKR
ncbi:hypothetical protein [Microvirga sp. VF16]|uniref:hypothetical protein n=1 Tax=Microvirga sp. VF16 TaxID=2807101 RepID=UPI00193C95B1|nr:hypothetical protein [Microvirga sp. VF16]QRM35453.1 hypothetical protein JO965_44760 [Microvirga sp. VF16]